ncbi:MAG TPA: aminotransferase class V-fold PLP-dependent enzyme [Myxococcales bacterium]|nr:aminotransferase class V-fold PLP-dependent enzyme [Myxococcales bacterium]
MDPSALQRALFHALRFRESLGERKVGAVASAEELRAALGGHLQDDPMPAAEVIDRLAEGAERGLVASAGPRFFGFVIGGSSEAAVAADWLTSAWDQNAGLYVLSPALAMCEEAAARWTLELIGLPPAASVGFVTGAQMANFTALAAARGEALRRAGWDVEQEGLAGGPPLTVIAGAEVHVTVARALRFLGCGERRLQRVEVDGQGRMKPAALAAALAQVHGPCIVCAQAGNVNSGAFDPLHEIAPLCRERGAWLHVDGAFGLWAGASPRLRGHVRGVELADSWATDAHKMLNVPYDSGIVAVANPDAHRRAMTATAEYLVKDRRERDGFEYVPEFSRRARGFAVWAQLRALGRRGVAELVERTCALAQRAAEGFARMPGAQVVNEVVFDQVLVAFDGGQSALDRACARIQADGTCWAAGSHWQGRPVLRFSVSGAATTEADVDRSLSAIAAAV